MASVKLHDDRLRRSLDPSALARPAAVTASWMSRATSASESSDPLRAAQMPTLAPSLTEPLGR